MTKILELENLCISDDATPILSRFNLSLNSRGLSVVMGPMGVGKSTLFKFLADELKSTPLTISFDKARYDGKDIGKSDRPVVVAQKIRESGDDSMRFALRQGEIETVFQSRAKLLCFDEPTAGLNKADGAVIMKRLRQIAKKKAVLVISHNLDEARKFADYILLIAGGRAVSFLPSSEFFSMPADAPETHYIKTGGLDLPYIDTPFQLLSPETRVVPKGFDQSPANPKPGVENWIIEGLFSLMALPVDGKGRLKTQSLDGLLPARFVYHFHLAQLEIYGPDGKITEQFTWESDDFKPDRNLALTAKICRHLDASIAAGHRVTFNTSFNQSSGAAILGAYLILKKFSPNDALELVKEKFPALHFGLRLEQFLWDMDIELLM